ncbi:MULTISPECIES: molybdopterin-dependent oxidoreductase [unclassified Streptomyces]|uniref:molybdopterin-dependent oxidoreductase n=1 Tax=unclassified Streptomyces TaxID=2593676 RepID=UPI0028849C5D|nr:molybdopterin-dependent oxidoreductase [Streptomyces sp. DSM 41633]
MNRRASLPAVAVVAVLVLAGCGDSTPEKATGSPAQSSPAAGAGPSTAASPAPAQKPGEVRVAGQVDKPYTVTLASLRGLPQKSVEVEYSSAKGQQKHTYQGVLLHDVLKDAQPRFDASKKNGQLRGVVAATGGGDYRAVFAWAELDPGFAKSEILLAVSEDGKPFDDAQGPRLVVPQDTKGGRYVSELNQLWVGTVDTTVDAAGGA